MCFFSTPKVEKSKPLPVAGPELVDQQANDAKMRELKRRRAMYGRQATMSAGKSAAGQTQPTGNIKTALGA